MMRRDRLEGEPIPLGWAVAYRDFDRDVTVLYPIPLQFLVRWLRTLRFWLMTVGRPSWVERHDHAIYLRGRTVGEIIGESRVRMDQAILERQAYRQAVQDICDRIEKHLSS